MTSLLSLRGGSAALVGLLLLVSPLSAQDALKFPEASPAATLTQRFGVTDVTIEYARPSVKNRKIFGGLVPYDEVWRAGANAATKITFSTPVTFGATLVPAGTYALFALPGKSEWTLILNQGSEQWGAYAYDAGKDVAKFTVAAQPQKPAVESFEISLDQLSVNGALLSLAWSDVRVSVPLKVDTTGILVPQIEAVMASDGEKKPYFPAAMLYFEAGLDLDKAAEWIALAAAAQPQAFWISYRQGLILEAKGDKAGALAAAEASLAAAQQATGAVKEEYLRLNEALIARLKA